MPGPSWFSAAIKGAKPMTPPRFTPAEMRSEADNCENNCGCDPSPEFGCSHSRRAAMLRQAAETQEEIDRAPELLDWKRIAAKERQKVKELREYHEVSVAFTMGSGGTYWLGFKDGHT